MSEMEIFKLVGNIFVDNEKANKGIDKTESKSAKMAKTFQKTGKTITKFGKIAAVGVGAAATGMVVLATKTGEAADRLLDLNSITGMSTDEIQKWERVATVAGVSADAMTNVSQKLTKQMDILSTGTGKAAEASEALGLSYEDLQNMNADERMNALVKSLQDIEDPTERARLGTDLLGGSWKDLAPILDVGAEKLQEVKDNANIISNDDLNQANEFRIKMDQMKERVSLFGQELAVRFIPILNKMFDWIETNMPTIQTVFDNVFTAISVVVDKAIVIFTDFLIPALTALWEWIEPNIPAIQELFEIAFTMISDLLENVWAFIQDNLIPILVGLFKWVSENMPIFKSIFKTAFDTIKTVIEAVWSVLELTLFPILQTLFTWVSDNMPLFQAIFEGAFSAIDTAVKFTKGVIEGIIDTITNMIDAIKDGLSWLSEFNSAEKPGTSSGKAKDSGYTPGAATGGTVMRGGPVRINEGLSGEIVNLPSGASVVPLNGRKAEDVMGGQNVNITITGNTLLGESDEVADAIGDVVVNRLRELAVGV